MHRLKNTCRVEEIWTRGVFEHHYQFDEQLMYGMLKNDVVHFNYFGNCSFSQSIMKCVLDRFKNDRENVKVF